MPRAQARPAAGTALIALRFGLALHHPIEAPKKQHRLKAGVVWSAIRCRDQRAFSKQATPSVPKRLAVVYSET
jgi:hypothetical protein